MWPWLLRVVLVLTLGVLIGLPLAMRPPEAHVPPGVPRIVIITPHHEQIRYEVGLAFRRWHEQHYGHPVEIDWRNLGGSSDIVRLLRTEYEALARAGREDDGAGYDLVFGGGDYLFDKLLKPGVTVTDPAGRRRQVSITVPIPFDETFVREVYPTPDIAGKPLYDPDGHWWGVVLSGFGIVYNRDVLRHRGLHEPARWEDLTHPAYLNWLALADPAHSGSVRATYEAIVQWYGWERGWRTLRRACANARYFTFESSQVPIDVSNGEVAAGMCVDFYGRYQAEAVGGDRVGYVAPAGETVVNADPIALLRGAPNRDLAIRFVRFVLSPPGQAVFCLHVGDPLGPVRFGLRRPPVRRDMYESYLDRMIDPVNYFDITRPLPPDTPRYFDVLPTVMHAMGIDVHEALQRAWRALLAEQDPRRRQAMEQLFDALPFTPQELAAAPARWKADPQAELRDRLAWTRFFLTHYRRVEEMGRQAARLPTTPTTPSR